MWAEVTVAAPAAGLELAAAALNALGANGVVMPAPDRREPGDEWAGSPKRTHWTGVTAYFPVDDGLGERLALLEARLAEACREVSLPRMRVTVRRIPEADWAETWKEHYRPVRVGRIVIAPTWEEYEKAADEILVRLDPGLAFGTGTHPSTQQSLLLLQQWLRPGDQILDIGTGCGVLAIAAALMGGGEVAACDIDAVAVAVAADNAATNGLAGRIRVIEGDLAAGVSGRFNLILANLVAHLHLRLIPDLPARMAKDGRAILAGIVRDREESVHSALAAGGLKVAAREERGEWVALVATC